MICSDCRRNSFLGINSSRNSPDSRRSFIHRLMISSCRLTSRSTSRDESCFCTVFSAIIHLPPEIPWPRALIMHASFSGTLGDQIHTPSAQHFVGGIGYLNTVEPKINRRARRTFSIYHFPFLNDHLQL